MTDRRPPPHRDGYRDYTPDEIDACVAHLGATGGVETPGSSDDYFVFERHTDLHQDQPTDSPCIRCFDHALQALAYYSALCTDAGIAAMIESEINLIRDEGSDSDADVGVVQWQSGLVRLEISHHG